MCRTRHVKPPCAVGCIVRDPTRLLRMSLQSFYPMMKSQNVVLTQTLNVPYLKATKLSGLEAGVNRHKVGVGKYIAIGKGWPSPAECGGIGNPMVQEHSSRPQQVPCSAEVLRQEVST